MAKYTQLLRQWSGSSESRRTAPALRVSAAVCVMGALGACGAIESASASRGTRAVGAPHLRPSAARTQSPACNLKQTRLPKVAAVDGLLGTGVITVRITNPTGAACVLSGYPAVVVLRRGRWRVQARTRKGEFGPREPVHVSTATLAANGGRAEFGVSFADHSGPDPSSGCRRFDALRVSLRGQPIPQVVALKPAAQACGGPARPYIYVSPIGPVAAHR